MNLQGYWIYLETNKLCKFGISVLPLYLIFIVFCISGSVKAGNLKTLAPCVSQR